MKTGRLRFARARRYIPGMDLKFWTKKLKEAEQELDAATRRADVNAAARKFMRAKAEVRRLGSIRQGSGAAEPATSS